LSAAPVSGFLADGPPADVFADAGVLRETLAGAGYLADERTAGVDSLAARLGKPILVEGPAGTG
jgi:MoxR-like ATPase